MFSEYHSHKCAQCLTGAKTTINRLFLTIFKSQLDVPAVVGVPKFKIHDLQNYRLTLKKIIVVFFLSKHTFAHKILEVHPSKYITCSLLCMIQLLFQLLFDHVLLKCGHAHFSRLQTLETPVLCKSINHPRVQNI